MTFLAARCPKCGGELKLDNQVESGFCMYCGSKILVQDAINMVRVDNSHLLESWMKMADSARETGNVREAYDYYTKIVEIDPSNWKAVFYKGLSAAYQSSYKNTRFDELIHAIRNSVDLSANYPKEKIVEIKKLMGVELIRVDASYYGITMNDILELSSTDFNGNISYFCISMRDAFSELIKGLQLTELNLALLDGLEDEEGKEMRQNCLAIIADKCFSISSVVPYIVGPGVKWLSGLPLSQKQKYIDRYDEIVYTIRMTEPQFHKDKIIDRIDPIFDVTTLEGKRGIIGEERKAENRRLSELAHKKISAKMERQYWQEHPEEYSAHLEDEQRKAEARKARALAEQKRKQELFEERKQKLQKEIDDHNLKLEELKRETGREIERLQQERESLSFLAMSKKKEIDQKILSLEKQVSDFAAKSETLRKQLKDLKP